MRGVQGKAASMEELKDQILLQLFAGARHGLALSHAALMAVMQDPAPGLP